MYTQGGKMAAILDGTGLAITFLKRYSYECMV